MKGLAFVVMFLTFGQFSFAQDEDAVFNKAEGLFGSGKYDEALQLYTQVLMSNPDNMNAHLRRGFCYSVLKEYDKSISDYSVVIHHHPDHPFAYLSRGSAYNKKELWEPALADFDMVLSLDPENQEAYNNRGWAKTGLGLYKEACQDWKTSRKLGNEEAKIILKNNNCK
ncbi:MAG: tetratricopeptide repeat protein [Flavobacteriales bacterium]|nr:tetratricopeptide repeat protein [Flavobacteriales bacterium]